MKVNDNRRWHMDQNYISQKYPTVCISNLQNAISINLHVVDWKNMREEDAVRVGVHAVKDSIELSSEKVEQIKGIIEDRFWQIEFQMRHKPIPEILFEVQTEESFSIFFLDGKAEQFGVIDDGKYFHADLSDEGKKFFSQIIQ